MQTYSVDNISLRQRLRNAMVRAPLARLLALCALAAPSGPLVLQAQEKAPASVAREWRQLRERQLVADYIEFLRIPNVSRDIPNIRRNAEYLQRAMASRGIESRLLEVSGAAPVVYGELRTPGATHTYVFYAHYDGQPVDPSGWSTPPFEPALRTARLDKGGQVLSLPAQGQPIDPEWRIYARSSSDDKAQIFAMLSALDALKAAGLKPRANIKFVFEGEEENGSPNLTRILQANRDLLRADLWLICDGPEHSSGRQTINFGARGIQRLEITVYGATRELHSGHYGNWAPNPAMELAQLLASMKDSSGRVTIDHFYDDVVPLSSIEKQAIASIPNNDVDLLRDIGLTRADGAGERLEELINLPSLNVRGISSGHVGSQASNVIPSTATAALDLRLVKGLTHETQAQRVVDHIRKQGYYVTASDPDDRIRQTYPKIAKVEIDPAGYDAVRTSMDFPGAQRVIAVVKGVRDPVILQPTSGGSLPLVIIQDILGTQTIQIPVANHDNNQHGSNENIRLANLWNAIETQAALLMMD